MPATDNMDASQFASKISARKNTKEEHGFDSEYRRLTEKLARKGGRITESEERRIEKYDNLDKDDYL